MGRNVSRQVVDRGRLDLCSVDDVLEVLLRAAIISRVEAGAFDCGLVWLVSAREQVAQIEEILGSAVVWYPARLQISTNGQLTRPFRRKQK